MTDRQSMIGYRNKAFGHNQFGICNRNHRILQKSDKSISAASGPTDNHFIKKLYFILKTGNMLSDTIGPFFAQEVG